ncbi:replication protein [Chloroflexota bacterium]
MANLQTGYTPVLNELMEALSIAPLGGVAKGAVLALYRITYGWIEGNGSKARKTEEEISNDGWAKLLNTNPMYAAKVVQELVKGRIILKTDLGQGKGYLYSVNLSINEWLGGQLNGLGLSERFKLPYTNKYRVPLTKRFTPIGTNSSVVNKNKINNKEKVSINNKEKKDIFDPERYRGQKFDHMVKRGSDDPDKYIKGKYGHVVHR